MNKLIILLVGVALVAFAGIAYSTWTYSGIDLQDNQVLVFISGQQPTLIEGDNSDFSDINDEYDPTPDDTEDIELDLSAPGRLQLPVQGARLTSRYGTRINPVTKQRHFHNGVDLAAPTGTPVRAPLSGKVTIVTNKYPCGNHLQIQGRLNGNIYTVDFCHLSAFLVKPGQQVTKGDVVAKVGNTGRSTGPHLHYIVKKDGKIVDPFGPDGHTDIKLSKGKVIATGTTSSTTAGATSSTSPGATTTAPPVGPVPVTATPTLDSQVLALATPCPGKGASDIQVPLSSIEYFIQLCSTKYGVNRNVLKAIILKESLCDATKLTVRPRAVSSAGARGLTQLMPITLADVNQARLTDEKITFDDLFTPSKSVCAGAHYINLIIHKYGITATNDVVQAYSKGPTAFKNGVRDQPYLDGVTKYYQQIVATNDPLPSDIKVA